MLIAALAYLSIPLSALLRASGEPVLEGRDPVELCAGREIAGDEARSLERFGATYLFSSEENLRRFEAEPERFEIQMGGGCGRMGPLSGNCSPARFAVHGERIYVFASDACRASFLAAPDKHLDRDDAPLGEAGLDREAGRALLEKLLAGLGGRERVDAVASTRWMKQVEQESGGKKYPTSESVTCRFPDDLRHDSSWGESSWFEVDTRRDGFRGPEAIETLHPESRRELRRQFGREPLFLARHREGDRFEVAAAGTRTVQGVECRELLVRFEGSRTSLFVDADSGRVLRAEWRGRLGSGPNGDVAVDYSDFRTVAGLTLPHAREVTFDGKPVAHRSGPLDELEVDAALPDDLFLR